MSDITVSFILPAAGSGTRMGSDIPKQFLKLQDRPLLLHTLDRISAYPDISEIVLVLSEDYIGYAEKEYGSELEKLGVTRIVAGADTRQQSVANGLAALEKDSQIIAVHDAVRPFISMRLMRELFDVAHRHGAALPVLPVTDTVKRMEDEIITKTVPRDGLYSVQTPQAFDSEVLRKAYAEAVTLGGEITDDATLVEKSGCHVRGVVGDRFNIKITTPEDLTLASALMDARLV